MKLASLKDLLSETIIAFLVGQLFASTEIKQLDEQVTDKNSTLELDDKSFKELFNTLINFFFHSKGSCSTLSSDW